jgi:hypothetical protein
MHWNALCDLHLPPDGKTKVWCNVSRCVFSGICSGPTRARNIVRRRFAPQKQCNAQRDPQILRDAKHKFNVTSPDAFFMRNAPIPHEHEEKCVDVSFPGGTEMHYVNCRYHQMQKHKFGVRCPDVFLWNLYRSHTSKKNSALTFRAPDAPQCST